MKVQILVDNPESWYFPYAKKMQEELANQGIDVKVCFRHKDITEGDILCLISCERKFEKLKLNKYNLVVHESALPKGKGWSPLTWQILDGENKIPITLFEATEEIDAGKIYYQDFLDYDGTELLPEIKHKQGVKTNEMLMRFITAYPTIQGIEQQGNESFYDRRIPKDSELDVHKTIDEQFNLLRVCDNNKYPAFFIKNGVKYLIKIEKADD